MSRTIDERVVELRFNNQQFEENARTSIGTLEKLKQMLNFSKSEKSLDDVSRSARRFNMNGIENAVDNIHGKFSALEIVGVTALVNIANQAINTGKQMLKSLTVAPIFDGFNEYELKMGSIQTIMMSTGESLENVNKKLDELNTYSDRTIYSFKDMTSNIGKFTNAGVGLDDAVKAIQGVSNVAAISGANTWEASRAMYNFAQALSSGSVRLIDWKSIENANMATVEFKQTLIDTAVALGTVVKKEDGYVTTTTDLTGKISDVFTPTKGFNDALAHQWMTTEVLTTALQGYSNDVRDMTDAERKAYHEKLISMGYTEDQAKRIEQLGSKAFDAAQEIKTFSQMMDTLKEAVGSGWAKTWETVFGDFNVAKRLWTGIGNFVGDYINKQSDKRNSLLEQWVNLWSIDDGGRGKLFRSFARIVDRVQEYIAPIKYAWRSIMPEIDVWTLRKITWGFSNLTKHMKWNGETYVNLGFAAKGFFAILRLIGTTALKVGQYGLPVLKEALDLVCRRLLELAGPVGYQVADMIKNLLESGDMDAFFKNISDNLINFIHKIDEGITVLQNGGLAGFKEWFVAQFEDVDFNKIRKSVVDKALSIVDSVGKVFGKENASDSIKKFGEQGASAFSKFLNKIKEAKTAFKTGGITGLGSWFKEQFEKIDFSKTLSSLSKKFEGFINRIGSLFGRENLFNDIRGFVTHWIDTISNWFNEQFEKFGFDKAYASFEAKFKPFAEGIQNIFGKENLFEKIGNIKDETIEKVRSFVSVIQSLFKSKDVENAGKGMMSQAESVNNATSLFDSIGKFFTNGNIISGIQEFVKSQPIFDKFGEAITTMKTSFGELGKLTEDFKTDAGNNIASFGDKFSSFMDNIGPTLSNIDWVGVAAAAGQIASMVFAFQALRTLATAVNTTKTVVSTATGTMTAVKGFFSKVNGVLDNFTVAKTWTAKFKSIAKSLFTLSLAIAIVAGAIKVLGEMDQRDLIEGGIAVGAILFALAAIQVVLSKFAKGSEVGTAANVLAFAIAVALIANALKDISSVLDDINSWQDAGKYVGALVVVFGSLLGSALALAAINKKFGSLGSIKSSISFLGFVIAIKLFVSTLQDIVKIKIDSWPDFIGKLGLVIGSLLALSFMASTATFGGGAGMIAMVGAIKLLMMTFDDITSLDLSKAADNIENFIAVFGSIFIIMALTNLAGSNARDAGIGILAIAIAIKLMVGVIDTLGSMEPKKALRGLAYLVNLMLAIGLVMVATIFAGENAIKGGIAIIAIAFSLYLLSGVVLILGSMKSSVAARGITAVLFLMLGIAGLMIATSKAGEHALTASIAIAIITLAIGGLVYAIYILGQMNSGDLIKAVTAIGIIMLIMGAMMVLSKFTATSNMAGIIAIAGSVVLLAAAVVALSFIPQEQLDQALWVIKQLAAIMAALMIAAQYTSGTSVGKILVLGICIGLLAVSMAGIALLLKKVNGNNMLKQMEGISLAIIAIGSVLGILSALNVDPGAAVKAGAAFDIFTTIIGLMVYAAGELDEMFNIGDKLDKGIEIMKKVGNAIGSFINGIVTGVLGNNTQQIDASKMEQLPTFGEKILGLVGGITTAANYVEGKESSIESLKSIAGVIMTFAKAELLDGVASFIGGASQFDDFSRTLDSLATGLADYADKVKGGAFDDESVQASIKMAELLATLYGSDDLRSGGFIGTIVGDSIGLDTFGSQLYELASGLISYSGLINTETFNEEKIEASTHLAKLLATLYGSDELKSGGVIGVITGDSIGLDTFGDQLQKLAQGLVLYSDEINGATFDEAQIEKSKNLAKMLIALSGSENLTRGGVLAAITGDVIPLDTFGMQLEKLAQGLQQYSDIINDANFDQSQIDKSEALAKMLASLASNEIPTDGGLLGMIFGKKDLSKFASGLTKLGQGVVDFVKKLEEGNISDAQVKQAQSMAVMLRTLANSASMGNTANMDKYGKQLKSFGTNLKAFLNDLSKIDTGMDISALGPLMDSVSELSKKYAETLNSISETSESISIDLSSPVEQLKTGAKDIESAVAMIDTALTSTFKQSWEEVSEIISSSGADMVAATKEVTDSATTALASSSVLTKWRSAGRALTVDLGRGIKNSVATNAVKRSAKDVSRSGSNAAKDTKGKWKDVGEALGDGLANGIKSRGSYVRRVAEKIVEDANRAAKSKAQSHSPSKVWARLGADLDRGLIVGMLKLGPAVNRTATSVMGDVITAAKEPLSTLADLISSDMMDDPVVRPVMDLSEIQNGANQLYAMMDEANQYSLHGNIDLAVGTSSSIDRDQNRRRQRDDDNTAAILDAVKALRKLADVPRNTYVIDGITYDDGSNVATAINMLIRAAKVGGRA